MSKGKEQNKTKKPREKQTSRKKKAKIKPGKEIDMVKFKKKIAEEMANAIPSKYIAPFIHHRIDANPLDEYDIKYREFISEDFTPTCIVFVNRLISDSKSLPIYLKNQNNFHKIILHVVKELMMGEYEITLLSLFLDYYGWINEPFSVEDNMLCIALAVKKALDSSDLFIKYYKRINKDIIERFEKWMELKKEKKKYSNNEINIRFMKLKKPFNTYCKTNYIDYNSVVDKILRMSLPYHENKQKDHESIPTINDSVHNSSHPITRNVISQSVDKKEIPFNPTEFIQNSSMNYKNSNSAENINFDKFTINQQNKTATTCIIQSNLRDELNNQTSQLNISKQDSQYKNNNSNSLKVTATSSNPYLPGTYFNNTAFKIDDNFINPEFNPMNAFWSQQSISDNNILGKLSAQNIDQGQQNQGEEDNLQHLLSKSNNNFFQSGISLKDYYNPELDPFNIRGSSLLSNKFEQLANEKVKNTSEGLINSNSTQGNTGISSIMNQSTTFNYSTKSDNYFQQAMNTLLNINPMMRNQLTNVNDISDSKVRNDSRKDLLGKFQQLQDQQTKNK